jgi:hypothetical protein
VVNVDELRAYYDSLTDEELERLAGTELVPLARAALEAEMKARGLPLQSTSNPYAAPKSAVSDPNAWATLTVSGLMRLFHTMVVVAALIGVFLFAWPYLPVPTAEGVNRLRQAAGADAFAPVLSYVIFLGIQPLWVLSAFGLYFFKWWGRPVLIGTYALSAISNILGGLIVWLPWESVLIAIATLLDGATLTLAYLPPLSTYFERDRSSG